MGCCGSSGVSASMSFPDRESIEVVEEKQVVMIDEPIPSQISFPRDHWGHLGAPTEWWYYVGTVQTSEGHTFGIEVNAANFFGVPLMWASIADVPSQTYYESYIPEFPNINPLEWCEYDGSKLWKVAMILPHPLSKRRHPFGEVNMSAPEDTNTDPTEPSPFCMNVSASFLADAHTDDSPVQKSIFCKVNLQLEHNGQPLLEMGDGMYRRTIDPNGKTPLTRNNYYYSLTNLKTSGTIRIGDKYKTIEVEGCGWMDHQFGAMGLRKGPGKGFGAWLWMCAQFEWCGEQIAFVNIATDVHGLLMEGQSVRSKTTFLIRGKSILVESSTTPMEEFLHQESPKHWNYFEEFSIAFLNEDVQRKLGWGDNPTFLLRASFRNQFFTIGGEKQMFEGVATCSGVIQNVPVSGTAWIEQEP